MANSIMPSAAEVRKDYIDDIKLQKSVAETIISTARQGENTVNIRVTKDQGAFLIPILKELGYLVIPYPVKEYNENNYYWSLHIAW